VRDYDLYGAAYSVLSAIGTGGLNAVVCGIPARDAGEFQAFPQSGPGTEASVDLYRTWFAWADTNQVRAPVREGINQSMCCRFCVGPLAGALMRPGPSWPCGWVC
jgi:hypothetical protein